ncbi:MAG: hypothetical protein PHQ14_14270 [Chromatiales bacterium]|nr:hypothetical protein [Chromatiales bacterium]
MNDRTNQWWEPVDLAVGQILRCTIGPLVLTLGRGEGDWRLAWDRQAQGDDARTLLREVTDGPFPGEQFERFISHRDGGTVRLEPRLADRPLVVRPRQPTFLPGGEETTFFISSPLWIAIEIGGRVLREIPVLELSDTWFGPSTREGEICYAMPTYARVALGDVPLRHHRAVTPVRIHNRANEPLPIEKLSLPVPVLAIHGCEDGQLWTQGVSLERKVEGDMAELRVDAGPPREAREPRLLSAARREPERGGLVRAFSGLFQ